jgi:cobalt/nickel transport system permease protein
MTAVVTVQAMLFQDGGLVVLGANIFIMGIVGTLGAYVAYRFLAGLFGGESRGRIPAAAVAAWLAVMGGALSIGLLLLASNATTLETMGIILGVHALIGIGEAAITVAALVFIQATRPDLFRLRDAFDPMRTRATQGA